MGSAARPGTDEVNRFWEERAHALAHADPDGFGYVCHRAPLFLNEFVDWSQRRAFDRVFPAVEFAAGDPAVDVGCGTGRWTRALAGRGLSPRGFDVAPSAVARAAELAPGIPFEVGSATALPLPDESQQVATCVTVLSHMPFADQEAAAAELARVLRPGGYLLATMLLDVVPAGKWCFARDRKGWDAIFAAHGLEPVAGVGEEYMTTPAVGAQWLTSGVLRLVRGPSVGSSRPPGVGRGPGALLYRAVMRPVVWASYPLEAAASRFWRRGPASGYAAVYRKPKLDLN